MRTFSLGKEQDRGKKWTEKSLLQTVPQVPQTKQTKIMKLELVSPFTKARSQKRNRPQGTLLLCVPTDRCPHWLPRGHCLSLQRASSRHSSMGTPSRQGHIYRKGHGSTLVRAHSTSALALRQEHIPKAHYTRWNRRENSGSPKQAYLPGRIFFLPELRQS